MKSVANYKFISDISRLPCVEKIYLFGSRARGDYRERSDIDIAISCSNATENEWQQILEIIEHADTLLHIDCVRLDQVDEKLHEKILSEGITLYDK
jgi:predicted nucleotidyltransferase